MVEYSLASLISCENIVLQQLIQFSDEKEKLNRREEFYALRKRLQAPIYTAPRVHFDPAQKELTLHKLLQNQES